MYLSKLRIMKSVLNVRLLVERKVLFFSADLKKNFLYVFTLQYYS